MTAPTRNAHQLAEADARVASWSSIPGMSGVRKCAAAGYTVDAVDGGFPTWCPDFDAVLQLLASRADGTRLHLPVTAGSAVLAESPGMSVV